MDELKLQQIILDSVGFSLLGISSVNQNSRIIEISNLFLAYPFADETEKIIISSRLNRLLTSVKLESFTQNILDF